MAPGSQSGDLWSAPDTCLSLVGLTGLLGTYGMTRGYKLEETAKGCFRDIVFNLRAMLYKAVPSM